MCCRMVLSVIGEHDRHYISDRPWRSSSCPIVRRQNAELPNDVRSHYGGIANPRKPAGNDSTGPTDVVHIVTDLVLKEELRGWVPGCTLCRATAITLNIFI